MDRFGEGAGVARQTKACTDLTNQLGWTVSHVYTDNDISAYSGRTRPEFEALLQAMKQGQYDALVCWHTDRLYRSMKDLERIIDIADRQRMEIRTVQGGNIDLSTASGRMVARILGSVAKQESEHASERRILANEQRASEGKPATNGTPPFGYTKDREIITEQARLVQKAMLDLLSGKAGRAIAREWNELGYRTPIAKKLWTGSDITKMLQNPAYGGWRVHRGKIVGKGIWEPIVDEETHHAVVAYLKDPARRTAFSYEKSYQGSSVYMCGICGKRMECKSASGRHRRAYRCPSLHLSRNGDYLDAYVDTVVLERLKTPDAPNLSGDNEAAVSVASARMKRDALQSRLEELASMFADGTIDGPQLTRGSKEIREHIERLDAQLLAAHKVSPLSLFEGNEDRIEEVWKNELSPDMRGKVIEALMTVVVYPMGRGRKKFNPNLVTILRPGENPILVGEDSSI